MISSIGNSRPNNYVQRSREQKYAFDNIFLKQGIEEIYEKTAKTLIKPIIDGFNGCVFAYGATGTGKTFTMLGNSETKGLCNLTLEDIFENIKAMEDYVFEVKVSFLGDF